MARKTNITSAIHHLKIAEELLLDYCRDNTGTVFTAIIKANAVSIGSVMQAMLKNPLLKSIHHIIRREMNADVWQVLSIMDMVNQVGPEQKDSIEEMMKQLLIQLKAHAVNYPAANEV